MVEVLAAFGGLVGGGGVLGEAGVCLGGEPVVERGAELGLDGGVLGAAGEVFHFCGVGGGVVELFVRAVHVTLDEVVGAGGL